MMALFFPTKLVFRNVEKDPLILSYAVAHYEGCFTLTGINDPHIVNIINEVEQWCTKNNCGQIIRTSNQILFNNEAELSFFLLRWS